MGKGHDLLSISQFVGKHLDARPRTVLPGITNLRTVPRTLALAKVCKARVVTGGIQPAYDREEDVIYMPSPLFYCLGRLWRRPVTYAINILHELTHFTGHSRRLGRRQHREPFDQIYLREELVAELGSALLCHDLSITKRPTLPHARYLDAYLRGVENPQVDLSVALSQANQAVAYLTTVAKRELE